MKLPKTTPRTAPVRPISWRLGLVLGACLLTLPVLRLHAEASVTTLGGGRLTPTGPDAGFSDGDILQLSQFHTPFGCAVDAGGRLLVADRDNGALRRLDLAANKSRTLLSGLKQPVATVVGSNDVVYVLTQGDGRIQKIDRGILGPVATGLRNPSAMAWDGKTTLFVTQTDGTVVRVSATDGAVSAPILSGLNQPGGLAVLDSGWLAISEIGGGVVRIWDPATGEAKQQIGTGVAGFADGPAAQAQFDRPHNLAKAPGGNIVVADRGNHRVRLIAPDGFVTTVYGVEPTTWEGPACTSCDPIILPGWLDGDVEYAEAREPVGVTVSSSGALYTTEVFYHLVREVSGLSLSGGQGGGGTNVVVLPCVISPSGGYYPMGQTISVYNPNTSALLPSAVYYTTDGTEPTTNSLRLAMTGDTGTLFWQEKLRDLTSLRVKPFLGENAGPIVGGQPVAAAEIGVTQDIAAGIGSRVIVPVVVNLRTNEALRSLQFRVEVTPESAGAPMIPETFDALSVSTNGLIPVVTSSDNKGTTSFQVLPYSFGPTRGLVVTFLGTNSNLSMKGFGVAAMLAVPIPPAAKMGDRYTIQVLNPSGTADAAQERVPLAPMAARSVVVGESRYLVGDASAATWYNAAQLEPSGALRAGFGDGILDNSDVNVAFAASLGMQTPYQGTDIFDALDAYPEDTVTAAGGDGLIRYLDWQVILMRSLGLDASSWERSWAEGGVRVSSGLAPNAAANSPGTLLVAPSPGAVWNRQVALSAQSLDRLTPGALFDVPIYVDVAPDAQLAGLAFRVRVEPEGAAPALERPIQFVHSPNLPSPTQTLAPSPDTVLCGWPLVPSSSFDPPLRGRMLLGYVRMALPISAAAGQKYTVRFSNADGSPDLQTQYDFETRPGSLCVSIAAPAQAQVISDEWKLHFFGSLTDDRTSPEADPDQDGAKNGSEYESGTNPTDARSCLQLQVSAAANRMGVTLRWLSAPGKRYQIEAAPSLFSTTWTVLATDLPGDGQWQQWSQETLASQSSFYRIRLKP